MPKKKKYIPTGRPVGRPITAQVKKICAHCNKEFITIRPKARFCSKYCGAKNRNWGVQALTPEQEQRRLVNQLKSARSEKNIDRLMDMRNIYGHEPIDPIFPTDEEDFQNW
jgi:hypothetical protein